MRLSDKQPILCLLALWITVGGCSKPAGQGRQPVYKVTGKITFLGNPVIGAAVSFSPQGSQPAAVGRTNDAGEYTLTTYAAGDGAAAGEYNVAVLLLDTGSAAAPDPAKSHFAPGGKTPESMSHAAGSSKSSKSAATMLPLKYGSPKDTPLRATVDPKKTNNFPFDVK